MVHNRQDAWTEDEDILLAETVLRYIREGKTQLEAFEEVAKQLSRTSAACGFRWNATVRKQYDKAIQLAKEERRNKDKQKPKVVEEENKQSKEPFEFDEAIDLLKRIKETYETSSASSNVVDERIQQISLENEVLKKKIEKYERALEEIKDIWKDVYTDEKEKQG
ncbi:RsfA family transcriptional regulator [Salinibacillus xinjiangensis]|uniref:RsfA family transcriptional regulator n=1 Tax=Salinibacillus xinjiangensis TaxID=1229268 RepID=A0A6G1X3M6_9BACI|nr:RsfA family transcriptional regulator [Salinibacillus xinjiangensis]MRG85506.1 RsfA family transcriptional regulator [Salinibacillus xinjiangensis]